MRWGARAGALWALSLWALCVQGLCRYMPSPASPCGYMRPRPLPLHACSPCPPPSTLVRCAHAYTHTQTCAQKLVCAKAGMCAAHTHLARTWPTHSRSTYIQAGHAGQQTDARLGLPLQVGAFMCRPSPTLSPTDPVPRGLLTLCPWASSGPHRAYIQPIYSLYAAYMPPICRAGTICLGFVCWWQA